MYNDVHIHTEASSDSRTSLDDQIARAVRLGMKYICITDHQDYDYPKWHCTYQLNENGDVGAYVNRLLEAREAWKDKIELLIGIEFGLQPQLAGLHNKVYAQYPFDMVIGSTHIFEGRDTEDQTLYEGRSKQASIRSYFETELENITVTDGFDTIGHLDYVLRDIPGKNEGFDWKDYADLIDAMLLTAIKKNKAVELNTKSLVIGMRDSSPGAGVFKRYHELGGKLVTLGSDAHFPERIGACFDIAGDILKEAGFRYYCVFKKHQPVFLPL
ncbi:MAG: histidinol-phosphatase HisJ family protein [Pyramidobacter sp.]|jgi:histidinol-phosphatase (PHP family)